MIFVFRITASCFNSFTLRLFLVLSLVQKEHLEGTWFSILTTYSNKAIYLQGKTLDVIFQISAVSKIMSIMQLSRIFKTYGQFQK